MREQTRLLIVQNVFKKDSFGITADSIDPNTVIVTGSGLTTRGHLPAWKVVGTASAVPKEIIASFQALNENFSKVKAPENVIRKHLEREMKKILDNSVKA